MYLSPFSLVMLQILWCALIDSKITIKTFQYYFLSCSTVSVEYFANKYIFSVLFGAVGQGKEVTNYATARHKTYMLFTSREVRIGKNCARRLGYGRGQYPRQRAQFFPIRTDLVLVNNIFIFF